MCHPCRQEVRSHPIWRLHPDWLVEPQNKENFPSLDAFEQRIWAWAFLQGFDVTREGAGTKASPALRLWCIHHGKDTQNTRNLEDRVQRGEDGKIFSDRKVDYANVAQLECPWKVRCFWKQLGMRNSEVFGFEVTYERECTAPSHALLLNPLEYVEHRKGTVEYRTQAAQATTHRIKTVPFSLSRRVLEDPEFGQSAGDQEHRSDLPIATVPCNRPEGAWSADGQLLQGFGIEDAHCRAPKSHDMTSELREDIDLQREPDARDSQASR